MSRYLNLCMCPEYRILKLNNESQNYNFPWKSINILHNYYYDSLQLLRWMRLRQTLCSHSDHTGAFTEIICKALYFVHWKQLPVQLAVQLRYSVHQVVTAAMMQGAWQKKEKNCLLGFKSPPSLLVLYTGVLAVLIRSEC